MRPFAPFLLALCVAVPSVSALAQPVEGLYRVREPLASQQPEAREEGLRRAFDTLVLRLTGDADAVSRPALAELRGNPQQAVSQFGTEASTLVVEFDPATVQASLRQAGLPLWGADRPGVLTWWLFDAEDGAHLVGDGQDGADLLRAAAQHRGLPVLVPLGDLTEQLAVTPEAVDGDASAALREVSSRYDADALLAVHARSGEGRWQGRWQLWLGDARTGGEVSGDSREALADAVMRAVHGFLAPRFVARPGASEALTLEVQGADIPRFAELERLLAPLGARLQRIEGDRLVYALRADPAQVRAQLALARLQEVPAEAVPLDASQSPVVPTPPAGAAGSAVAATPSVSALPPAPVAEQVLHYRW